MVTKGDPGQIPPREKKVPSLETGHAIALMALILSLGATVTNAWFFVAGSDVRFLPPTEAMFYREGEPPGGVLKVAIPVRLVNRAISNFGDTVIGHDLQFEFSDGSAIDFPRPESTVIAILSNIPPPSNSCALPAKCFSIDKVQFLETPATFLDLAGSSSTENYLSFTLIQRSCIDSNSTCKFYDFNRSVTALSAVEAFTLTVHLEDDGKKRVRCKLSGVNTAYLRRTGILTLDRLSCD